MADQSVCGAPKSVAVFVLAKNEQANIGRCLDCLKGSDWDVTVLDSGSTDETLSIVERSGFARIERYAYVDHCQAYNEITTKLGAGYQNVIILDADMMMSLALQAEIRSLLSQPGSRPQVVEAAIQMCVEGVPLKFGSLYPPKAFVFEVGRAYFVNTGHGEALVAGTKSVRAQESLTHDDRKGYSAYLQSQIRYSRNLVTRLAAGQATGRDRLRTTTPLLILAVPFVSYILKGGFLSGKAGAIYALDRLIAEAIMYRRSLSGVVND